MVGDDGSDWEAAGARLHEMREPLEIVEAALLRPGLFKSALTRLRELPPREDAALRLVEAYAKGETPDYLASSLLGGNGHAAGYQTVLQILRSKRRNTLAVYAAIALTEIAGEFAEPDLVAVIDEIDDGPVRKAAALALGRIGSGSALAALINFLGTGRLRALSVARALQERDAAPATLTASLRSEIHEVRRWVPMMLAEHHRHRARSMGPLPVPNDAGFRDALEDVLAEGVATVWRSDATCIREWLSGDE